MWILIIECKSMINLICLSIYKMPLVTGVLLTQKLKKLYWGSHFCDLLSKYVQGSFNYVKNDYLPLKLHLLDRWGGNSYIMV